MAPKDVCVLIPMICEYIIYMEKGTLQIWLSLRWEIILNYPVGVSLITQVLQSVNGLQKADESDVMWGPAATALKMEGGA